QVRPMRRYRSLWGVNVYVKSLWGTLAVAALNTFVSTPRLVSASVGFSQSAPKWTRIFVASGSDGMPCAWTPAASSTARAAQKPIVIFTNEYRSDLEAEGTGGSEEEQEQGPARRESAKPIA